MRTEEGDWTASRHISEGHLVAQGTAKGDTQEKKQDTKRLCRVDMRARHTHAGQRAKPRRSDTRWGRGSFLVFSEFGKMACIPFISETEAVRVCLYTRGGGGLPRPLLGSAGLFQSPGDGTGGQGPPGGPPGGPPQLPPPPARLSHTWRARWPPQGRQLSPPPAKCVPNPCISQPDRLSARRPAPPAQSCRPMSPEGLGENSAHLSDDPTCSSQGHRKISCIVIRLCPGPYVQLPPPPGFILTNRTLSLMRRVCISGSC